MNKMASSQRVAIAHLEGLDSTRHVRVRTAGEVRHVKDNTGDASTWAYNLHSPSNREIPSNFEFDRKSHEQMSRVMRSGLQALGFASTAYITLSKIKSRKVSPDGKIGGRGYTMTLKDVRRQLSNVVEALSQVTDTLFDEVTAPHHAQATRATEKIIEHAEEIREDPEGWAEAETEEDQEQRVGDV